MKEICPILEVIETLVNTFNYKVNYLVSISRTTKFECFI